jgi:hypothetical protein
MLSADGYLMPAKKGQAPPDLRCSIRIAVTFRTRAFRLPP